MRGQQGQATVELALVLPFLLALMLVMVQGALVLRDQLALDSAVREAARTAVVDPDPRAAEAAADAVLPGAKLSAWDRPSPGENLRVEVDYRSVTQVPLVGRLLPDPLLRARAVMRVEQ